MNAVKSVQLKYDKFANLPLGSPKTFSHHVIQKAQCECRKLHTYCLMRQPVVKAHQPSVDRCDGL